MFVPWWWLLEQAETCSKFRTIWGIVWNTTVIDRLSVCSSVWYTIILCLRLFLLCDPPPLDFTTNILYAMRDFDFTCLALSCAEFVYGAQWDCGAWNPLLGRDHVVGVGFRKMDGTIHYSVCIILCFKLEILFGCFIYDNFDTGTTRLYVC